MEADVAAEVLGELKSAGTPVGHLVGDDSSAIKKVRQLVSEDIRKSSDMNHFSKNLGNHLYSLKSAGHKEPSEMVIKHIQK